VTLGDRRSDLIGWSGLVVVSLVAVLVASLASAPPIAAPADDAIMRDSFRQIAFEESSARGKSAHTFPGDLWSQDDDYHAAEAKKMRALAGERQVRLDDVIRGVDDGMREGWSPRGLMTPGVPPCRPRLDY
jgi:hypothetical protein